MYPQWEQATNLQIPHQNGKVPTHSQVGPWILQAVSSMHRRISQIVGVVGRSLQQSIKRPQTWNSRMVLQMQGNAHYIVRSETNRSQRQETAISEIWLSPDLYADLVIQKR